MAHIGAPIHGTDWHPPHGTLTRLETEEGSEEHEGHRYAKPHQQEGHHRAERDRAGGSLRPDEEVEDEEGGRDDGGVEEAGEQGHLFPLGAAERLVRVGGEITRRDSHEHEEEQGRTVSRWDWDRWKPGKVQACVVAGWGDGGAEG